MVTTSVLAKTAEFTANETLLNSGVRHALALERYKTGEVERTIGFLNKKLLPDLLRQNQKRLARITQRGLDTGPWTTQRYKDLLAANRTLVRAAYTRMGGEFKVRLGDLAISEGEWAAASVRQALPVSMEMLLPSSALLKTVVTRTPIRGTVMDEWIGRLSLGTSRRVNEQIRLGLLQGETVPAMIRRIRGTRAANFADGVFETSRREAATLVRTSVNHVSNAARELTYKENSDVIKSVMWVSTLDHRTCFRSGTVVWSLYGPKDIESIAPGEVVLSGHGRWRRVLATLEQEADDWVVLTLEGGEEIECTATHPFWSEGRWVEAQYLSAGSPIGTERSALPHLRKPDGRSRASVLQPDLLGDLQARCPEAEGASAEQQMRAVREINERPRATILQPILLWKVEAVVEDEAGSLQGVREADAVAAREEKGLGEVLLDGLLQHSAETATADVPAMRGQFQESEQTEILRPGVLLPRPRCDVPHQKLPSVWEDVPSQRDICGPIRQRWPVLFGSLPQSPSTQTSRIESRTHAQDVAGPVHAAIQSGHDGAIPRFPTFAWTQEEDGSRSRCATLARHRTGQEERSYEGSGSCGARLVNAANSCCSMEQGEGDGGNRGHRVGGGPCPTGRAVVRSVRRYRRSQRCYDIEVEHDHCYIVGDAGLIAHNSDICMSLDGQTWPVGQGQRPPAHHLCRSTTVPITKSWKELGIDLSESPPGTRASMNGQVPDKLRYPQWLKRMDKDPATRGIVDQALGPRKAALWRRGLIDLTKVPPRGKPSLTLRALRETEGLGVGFRNGRPVLEKLGDGEYAWGDFRISGLPRKVPWNQRTRYDVFKGDRLVGARPTLAGAEEALKRGTIGPSTTPPPPGVPKPPKPPKPKRPPNPGGKEVREAVLEVEQRYMPQQVALVKERADLSNRMEIQRQKLIETRDDLVELRAARKALSAEQNAVLKDLATVENNLAILGGDQKAFQNQLKGIPSFTSPEARPIVKNLNRVEDRIKALEGDRAVLSSRIDALSSELRSNSALMNSKVLDSPEMLAFQKANDDIISRTERFRRARRAEVLRILTVNDPALVEFEGLEALFASSEASEFSKKIKVTRQWLRRLISREALDGHTLRIGWRPVNVRAHASGGLASVKSSDSVGVFLHESGHAVEQQFPKWGRAANGHLQKRTVGEKSVKLKDLKPGSGYEVREVTKPDRFMDEYWGKQYDNTHNISNPRAVEGSGLGRLGRRRQEAGIPEVPKRGPVGIPSTTEAIERANAGQQRAWAEVIAPYSDTEITSMALQTLFENPFGLAKSDPDSFDWIINTIRGYVGKKKPPVPKPKPKPKPTRPEDFKPLNPKGKDTMEMFQDPKTGAWTAERVGLHDDIANKFLAGAEKSDDPVYQMMGGGPASGKSVAIETGAVKLPKKHVFVNADDIKAEIPEFKAMTKAKNDRAAAFTHNESSVLSDRIMGTARAKQSDIVLDGVGDGGIADLERRILPMRAAGYRIKAAYVTVDTETAIARNVARAKATGRKVPVEYIRHAHGQISEILEEAIDRGLFDELVLLDTNAAKPKVIFRYINGKKEILDHQAWNRFLAKAPSRQKAAMKPVNPAGKDTVEQFVDPKTGAWTVERQALHNDIAGKFLANIEPSEEKVYHMLGGGPAAGKTSAIRSGFAKLPDRHALIAADEIKEQIPEFKTSLRRFKAGRQAADEDVASFVHNESTYVSERMLTTARQAETNIVLDGTGDGALADLRRRILPMREAGYRIDATYVTIDTDEAVKRAIARAARSGRKVPEAVIRAKHAKISEILPKAIDEGLFDNLTLVDNNGKAPKLIMRVVNGKKEIVDEALWKRFLAKAEPELPPIPKTFKPLKPKGKDTLDQFWDPVAKKWTTERKTLHDHAMHAMTKGVTPEAEKVYHMMGGGSASGKGVAIHGDEALGIKPIVKTPKNRVFVDSDKIKKDWLPEFQKMIDAGDVERAAAFVHNESSILGDRAMAIARERGLNVVLDGTGDGTLEKLLRRVQPMKDAGYKVKASYVTVDTEVALSRNFDRARKTGREVPTKYVREVHAQVSDTLQEAIEKNVFDELEVIDTNGRAPRIIFRMIGGKKEILDDVAWRRFLAKGQKYQARKLDEMADLGLHPQIPRRKPQVTSLGHPEDRLVVMADSAGEEWFVKTGLSLAEAQEQALASALYRKAGIDAVEWTVVQHQGKPALVARITEISDDGLRGLKKAPHKPPTQPTIASQRADFGNLYDGYAADAWLGNVGVVEAHGTSEVVPTILRTADGRMVRSSVDKAITTDRQIVEALGAKKQPLREWANEFFEMRDGGSSKLTFGWMETDDLIASIEKVVAIPEGEIIKTAHRLIPDANRAVELSNLLLNRQRDLLKIGDDLMRHREYIQGLSADKLKALRAFSEEGKYAVIRKIQTGEVACEAFPVECAHAKLLKDVIEGAPPVRRGANIYRGQSRKPWQLPNDPDKWAGRQFSFGADTSFSTSRGVAKDFDDILFVVKNSKQHLDTMPGAKHISEVERLVSGATQYVIEGVERIPPKFSFEAEKVIVTLRETASKATGQKMPLKAAGIQTIDDAKAVFKQHKIKTDIDQMDPEMARSVARVIENTDHVLRKTQPTGFKGITLVDDLDSVVEFDEFKGVLKLNREFWSADGSAQKFVKVLTEGGHKMVTPEYAVLHEVALAMTRSDKFGGQIVGRMRDLVRKGTVKGRGVMHDRVDLRNLFAREMAETVMTPHAARTEAQRAIAGLMDDIGVLPDLSSPLPKLGAILDISDFKPLGPSRITREAPHLFEDAQGKKWYVRTGTEEDAIRRETVAAQLYRAAGVDHLDMKPAMQRGSLVSAAPFDEYQMAGVAAHGKDFYSGYGVDVWLRNWRVFDDPSQTTALTRYSRPVRVDSTTAMSMTKTGDVFSGTSDDFFRLRDRSVAARTPFTSMKSEHLIASLQKVEDVSEDTIEKLVRRYGPTDAAENENLVAVLKSRRRDLVAIKKDLEVQREWMAAWDEEAVLSGNNFTGSGYATIRKIQDGRFSCADYPEACKHAKRLSVLQQQAPPLERETAIYRGVRHPPYAIASRYGKDPEKWVDAEFSWGATTSFSTSKEVAKGFADDIMFIVPKSRRNLDITSKFGIPSEMERFVAPTQRYRVASVRRADRVEGFPTGGRTIIVELEEIVLANPADELKAFEEALAKELRTVAQARKRADVKAVLTKKLAEPYKEVRLGTMEVDTAKEVGTALEAMESFSAKVGLRGVEVSKSLEFTRLLKIEDGLLKLNKMVFMPQNHVMLRAMVEHAGFANLRELIIGEIAKQVWRKSPEAMKTYFRRQWAQDGIRVTAGHEPRLFGWQFSDLTKLTKHQIENDYGLSAFTIEEEMGIAVPFLGP